eukprot:4273423-Alexandrium_andersonii.AAC.1
MEAEAAVVGAPARPPLSRRGCRIDVTVALALLLVPGGDAGADDTHGAVFVCGVLLCLPRS